jgi:hypothetical protein
MRQPASSPGFAVISDAVRHRPSVPMEQWFDLNRQRPRAFRLLLFFLATHHKQYCAHLCGSFPRGAVVGFGRFLARTLDRYHLKARSESRPGLQVVFSTLLAAPPLKVSASDSAERSFFRAQARQSQELFRYAGSPYARGRQMPASESPQTNARSPADEGGTAAFREPSPTPKP